MPIRPTRTDEKACNNTLLQFLLPFIPTDLQLKQYNSTRLMTLTPLLQLLTGTLVTDPQYYLINLINIKKTDILWSLKIPAESGPKMIIYYILYRIYIYI